jgi:decaprenyl-phosphate phosphoribosyltransferase
VKILTKLALISLRPKQWTKNLLLFVAPFAAGVTKSELLLNAFIGFIAFSAASSIGYVMNDLGDLEMDRKHPKKKFRPFASGSLSLATGIVIIVFLFGILVALLVNTPTEFNICVLVYIMNTFLYSRFLKNVPVIDMFMVAFGFVLRLIAGALVVNLVISEWFLIVGGFGALFIVSHKRLAELNNNEVEDVRLVVNSYSLEFLNSISSICVSVSLTAYSIWAFSQESDSFWYQMSIIPIAMSFFRYTWMSARIDLESPEDAILEDKVMIALAAASLFILAIAIY